MALVLAVDISRSVDSIEYELQRGGLAYAIRHPDVIAAIKTFRKGQQLEGLTIREMIEEGRL